MEVREYEPEKELAQSKAEDRYGDLINMGEPMQEPKMIKVVGVGNGGCNAVDNMYAENIENVSCLICDSNNSALQSHKSVPRRLLLGDGAGFGGNVGRGREVTEAQADEIRDALNDGAKMVIIATALGGGTGTAAAPIVAREAKKLGLLTIAIAILPPSREKLPRILPALDGLDMLAKEVDALLVISNDRIQEVYSEEAVDVGFKMADNVLCDAVRSIAGIISMIGIITMDFSDIKTALTKSGVAVISTGKGIGTNRVTDAIEKAITSPILNNNDVYKATHLLIRITYDKTGGSVLQMKEFKQIDAFADKFDKNTWVKVGIDAEEGLGEEVRVTILAAGFGLYEVQDDAEKSNTDDVRIKRFYPTLASNEAPKPAVPSDTDDPKDEPGEEPPSTSEPEGKGLWNKFSDFVEKMLND